jgi:multidrug efflux pump subunit AcrA (membrane-fusion protein)
VVDSGDVVIRLEADEIEQKVLQARDELAMARAEAERTHAEMVLERVMLKSQQQTTVAALETARLQMAQLSFESASIREQKRLEIKIAELENKKIARKLQSLETIQQEEMSRLKLKIAQAHNRLTQAQNTLDKLILRAPARGMVVYERNWMTDEPIKEQDTVFPTMPLIRIPRLSVMDVELKVDETDAQRLENNQEAWIYPAIRPDIKLPGRVIYVGKVAKPISRGSRVRKVDVTVQIDSTHDILTAGQSADVEIVVSSMDSVITVPLDCVFVRDSVNVIYQYRSGRYQLWPVTVLSRGEDFAAVDADLPREFDCALIEPDASRLIQP